jgi:hypothetical protein
MKGAFHKFYSYRGYKYGGIESVSFLLGVSGPFLSVGWGILGVGNFLYARFQEKFYAA